MKHTGKAREWQGCTLENFEELLNPNRTPAPPLSNTAAWQIFIWECYHSLNHRNGSVVFILPLYFSTQLHVFLPECTMLLCTKAMLGQSPGLLDSV